jgi:SAM-dependent methyltransferase
VVAFYAIAHFRNKELVQFFSEAHRILKPGGQLLISFHIGDDVKTVDELLGVKASADFYFNQVETIYDLLVAQGFIPIDTMTRYPYTVEFPSKRAYILVMK